MTRPACRADLTPGPRAHGKENCRCAYPADGFDNAPPAAAAAWPSPGCSPTRCALKSAEFGTSFLIPHQDRFFLFTDRGNLILAELSLSGYREIGRTKIIEPTQANSSRGVVWRHPVFANRCVDARTDKVIACVSLAR